MNYIAFSGPRNCVNTQYAALSGAMPDAYICNASAQKAELNVVGVLEVSRGKCASLNSGSSV